MGTTLVAFNVTNVTKKEGNKDRIEEFSDEDEEQAVGQCDSSAEEVEESETKEERDLDWNEKQREARSAVVCIEAEHVFVYEIWKRTDKVTRDDDEWAHIDSEVPEVSTGASNQEMGTIRKAVAFSKQPAKADPIQNMTPKTAQAPKVPPK